MPESTHKCEYCGSMIKSSEQTCPHCGAPNTNYIAPDERRKITQPKTIEELQMYCANRGMPLYKMRFFIGENTHEARAFGIYRKSNGEVVVYKNKDDGSRAIRYEGPDEAYGVNEIYQKLLSEIAMRQGGGAKPVQNKPARTAMLIFIVVLCACIAGSCAACVACTPDNGYYDYNGDLYYYSNDWYRWDSNANDWSYAPYVAGTDLDNNYRSYESDNSAYQSYGASSFTDSDYYTDYSSSSDSYSSDYDTWDSWDSGSTDWGSDW